MPVGRVFVDWVVRGDCGRHTSPRDADRRYWTVEASAFSYIRRYEREITIAVTILSGHSTVVLLHCAASRMSRGEVAIVTKDPHCCGAGGICTNPTWMFTGRCFGYAHHHFRQHQRADHAHRRARSAGDRR